MLDAAKKGGGNKITGGSNRKGKSGVRTRVVNPFQRRDSLALSSWKRASRFVIPSLRSRASSERELALERSEGMTLLPRLRLTRKTSSLKWIDPCSRPRWCEPGINTAWRKSEALRAATLPRSRRSGPSVHDRGDPLSPRVAQRDNKKPRMGQLAMSLLSFCLLLL